MLAVGFGFGPRVAGAVLAEKLGWSAPNWFPEYGAPEALGRSYRILLNFGVTDLRIALIDANVRIWIDCLGWLRKSPPSIIVNTHQVLLWERFFDHVDSPSHANVGIPIEPLVRWAGTARLDAPRGSSRRRIVVCFGGIETPYSTRTHNLDMPHQILRGIATHIDDAAHTCRPSRLVSQPQIGLREESDEPLVECYLPEPLLSECRNDPALAALTLRTSNADEYRDALQKCSLAILQPGLYGPFEAFSFGVPVKLTFPMSYSQAYQYGTYREAGLTSESDSALAKLEGSGRNVEIDEPEWFRSTHEWWISGGAAECSAYIARLVVDWFSETQMPARSAQTRGRVLVEKAQSEQSLPNVLHKLKLI